MDHLLAKTRGRNGRFFKLISERTIFEVPENSNNYVQFTSDYKLDEDQWFGIQKFSDQEYCIEFLKQRFISANFNQLLRSDYSNLEFLVAVQDEVYFFQQLTPSQIIKKRHIALSGEPNIIENSPLIVLNQIPDAIYFDEGDLLIFKKLTTISHIFKGIDTLYKEATQAETEAFLANKFVRLGDGFCADQVKKANRKRIAMAMETLGTFNRVQKRKISDYLKDYCPSLGFDEKDASFSISNEEELKQLLYGIEQRYYTTIIDSEKRLANSVIAL